MHRNFSKISASAIAHRVVQKSVFISQSTNVYANLALERWLYKNFDFSDHQVLMFYRNEPCVVLGKSQNPWVDVVSNKEQVARRSNEGETVYNDQGNLNMTFFSHVDSYDKGRNLALIARAAFREYGTKVLHDSDDLNIRNSKISYSSAQLGGANAYHQCTLLVDMNKSNSQLFLRPETDASERPKLLNLREENPKIGINKLLTAIGWEYLRTNVDSFKDGGIELARKQRGFHMINPTDNWFPGLADIKDNLQSWEWRFGETPKFKMSKSFPLVGGNDVKITVTVDKGRISDVNLYVPNSLSNSVFVGVENILSLLRGCKFTDDVFLPLEKFLEDHHGGNTYEARKIVMSV